MDRCFRGEHATRKCCQVLVMTRDKGAPERTETDETCPNVHHRQSRVPDEIFLPVLFFSPPLYARISKARVKVATYSVSALVLTRGFAASVCQRPERPRWWGRSCCTRVLLTGSGSRPNGGLHMWLFCTPASVLLYYLKIK